MKLHLLPAVVLVLAQLGSCAGPQVRATQAQPAAEAKGDAKADEAALRRKQREVEYAELALSSARLDAENELRSAERAVGAAERELGAAERELEHFDKRLKPFELDERALSVARAKQNVVEAAEELAELEAMYAQEDFAKTTKELVMTRGRTRLEMSRRDLKLAERRAHFLAEFEHQKRAQELEERLTKSRHGLDEARARQSKLQLDKRLSLLKAEHALEDAKRALDESKAGAKPQA